MNKIELVGRLTRDPEARVSSDDNSVSMVRLSVAINRKYKNASGDYDADFPSCVAFGKTAEFIEKYFKKGMAIGIVGRIQTGSYTNKDGNTVYTTDVVVEEAEFVESKKSAEEAMNKSTKIDNDDFMNIPDDVDELPFN